MMQTQTESADEKGVVFTPATRADLPLLQDIVRGMQQSKDPDYFELCFEQQDLGRRQIYFIRTGQATAGYGILNWNPKYGFFRVNNIPEIQDLNILPSFRQRGLASAFIGYCEGLARGRGQGIMGISVGLHARFGPAQRLYVKLGYEPDGLGVTYDRMTVSPGEMRLVDDNLCLMMVKALG